MVKASIETSIFDDSRHASGIRPLDHTRDAFLDGGLILLQPKSGPRAAIDALFLAAAVPEEEGQSCRVLEAGSGSGIVSLALAWRIADAEICGIEIEPELVTLARESAHVNGYSDRVSFIEGDLTQFGHGQDIAGLEAGSFDHVAANPPYYVEGSARRSTNRLKQSAQMAGPDDLAKWIDFLEAMVAARGTLTLIHRSEALGEILNLLKGRFGDLVIFPLFPHAGDAARRVIIQGQKGSKAPLKLLPGLVLHERGGEFTPGADAVLRRGRPLRLHL